MPGAPDQGGGAFTPCLSARVKVNGVAELRPKLVTLA